MGETFVYIGHYCFDRFDEDEDDDAERMITHAIIDKSVTEVWRDLSMFPNLRRVDFHPNLRKIGSFADCRFLEEVDLPKNLETIEGHAFEGSGIRSIIIPPKVKILERYCFSNCFQLEFAGLSEGIEYIDEKAFMNCPKLREINIPSTIKISDLYNQDIHEASWFYGCTKLESVHLPSTLRTIPCWCFKNCTNLEHIQLKEGLVTIDRGAFVNSGLKRISIPSSLLHLGGDSFPHMTGEVFQNCRHLKSVDLPERLSCIACKTFEGCCSLESIVLPNSVHSIWGCAFKDCTSLTRVTIRADHLRRIEPDAFHGCVHLRTIQASPAVLSLVLQKGMHHVGFLIVRTAFTID